MKAKKLLAMFLTVCMIISAIPAATFMSVSADGTLGYVMVKLTSFTTSSGTINKESTSEPDGGNVSTGDGSVAVYNVNFGTDSYRSVQIFYSGRDAATKCPPGANINVYLGDYVSNSAGCTLLANVKVPPHNDNWDARCFSEIINLAQSLTGSQTISLQFVGNSAGGYASVANARQMFFFKNTVKPNLKDYVNATDVLAVSGSTTKTSASNEGTKELFNGYTDSKLNISWSSGVDVVVTYNTFVPVTVDYYTYLTANDSDIRDPKSWQLYGSTNGTNYTLIDTVTDFAAYTTRRAFCGDFFQIDNPGAYQYYKLIFKDVRGPGANSIQLSELSLYGSVNGTSEDSNAVKNVVNLINTIGTKTALSADYYTAIEAANTAYTSLSSTLKAYVTNLGVLNAALNIYNAKTIVSEAFATDIYNLMKAIDGIYPMYNHSDTVIGTVQNTYNTVCTTYTAATVDTYLTNKAKLTGAMSAYHDHMANFNIIVTGTGTSGNYPWIANFSADDWTASRNAIADEVKYHYQNGVDLGGVNGKSYGLGTDEGSIGIQLDNWGSGRNTDNAWNPWGQGGRYWAKTSIPFSGMAFTRAGYFSINGYGGDSPIGEPFTMDGKTYQLYFSSIRSYNTTPIVNGKTDVTVTKTDIYPGSGTYSTVIGNIFRYFTADYNQTNKYTSNYVTGKNIGIPTAHAAYGGASTYYQRFKNATGISYIVSNAGILDDVTISTSSAGYEAQLAVAADQTFIIGNDLATAIETRETDLGALLTKAGDLDLAASTSSILKFTNGTFTVADGYVQTVTEEQLRQQAADVDSMIDAIGTVTLEPTCLAKINTAEAAFNALLDEAKIFVTKGAALENAKNTYSALIAAKVKLDNGKYVKPVSGSRPDENEGFKKMFDGDPSTKMYMSSSNYADTVWSAAIPVKAVAYGLTTGGDTEKYPDRNPQSITLYGSEDGNSWTQIDYQANPNMPSANTTEKVFYINAPANYKYYKIAFNSGSTIQLAEITLYTAANYNSVMDAIKAVPTDVSMYTSASVTALSDAVSAVVYGLDGSEQERISGFAQAIDDAVADLTLKLADYSSVTEAIGNVPADLSIYTDTTVAKVNAAIEAVDYNLLPADQAKVDGYADAINNAVAGLVKKAVEMNITISEGMVSESVTNSGKYDITWNATIQTGSQTSIDGINDAGITFKKYGVYYAVGEEVLEDYANASADEIRDKVFGSGEDIDVYTMFGFRLKGVTKDAVRAAMFYVEYEYEGQTYIVLSTINETIATIHVD